MMNTSQLKEFLGCDDEFLFSLMRTFLKESDEGIKRLVSGNEASDWPLVRATAHKMLSSTRIFQLEELSRALEIVEKMAGQQSETDKIAEKLGRIVELWSIAEADIKDALSKTGR